MKFSDKDLEQERKMLDPVGAEAITGMPLEKRRAYLARLDTAERIAQDKFDRGWRDDKMVIAWRKAMMLHS